jgi:ATP-dependent Clp protease, protease subunit
MRPTIIFCLTLLAGRVHAAGVIEFRTEVNALSVMVFKSHLAAHAADTQIDIVIDTPGGDVWAGLDMAKAIAALPQTVCTVDGLGASMGLYILQSCGRRVMTDSSLLMGHAPSTEAEGHEEDLVQMAEVLGQLHRALAAPICRRTKLSVDQYLQLTANGRELWMSGGRALALGFVDAVVAAAPTAALP